MKGVDQVPLGDIRLFRRAEHIVDGGGWFADVGYAFDRHYEFESDQIKNDLSDGLLLQAGCPAPRQYGVNRPEAMVDIIQGVGRAIRKAAGRHTLLTFGLVVATFGFA